VTLLWRNSCCLGVKIKCAKSPEIEVLWNGGRGRREIMGAPMSARYDVELVGAAKRHGATVAGAPTLCCAG
jgi:hypothetical protein